MRRQKKLTNRFALAFALCRGDVASRARHHFFALARLAWQKCSFATRRNYTRVFMSAALAIIALGKTFSGQKGCGGEGQVAAPPSPPHSANVEQQYIPVIVSSVGPLKN